MAWEVRWLYPSRQISCISLQISAINVCLVPKMVWNISNLSKMVSRISLFFHCKLFFSKSTSRAAMAPSGRFGDREGSITFASSRARVTSYSIFAVTYPYNYMQRTRLLAAPVRIKRSMNFSCRLVNINEIIIATGDLRREQNCRILCMNSLCKII